MFTRFILIRMVMFEIMMQGIQLENELKISTIQKHGIISLSIDMRHWFIT